MDQHEPPYRDPVPTSTPTGTAQAAPARTLWEVGRQPGRLVVCAALGIVATVVILGLLIGGHVGVSFDLAFVLVCVAAALLVRPRDFFSVGVLPPLLLAAVVCVVAAVDRAAVARADDAYLQAVVSGLAHHAMALLVGYGLTLAVLALRQVALRNNGALRPKVAAAHHRALTDG